LIDLESRILLKFIVRVINRLTFFIGSDFVTMIQIDCAVTDTKTLHIRDTHLRHNNDFKNNVSANLKQQHGIIIYFINIYLIIM